LPKSEVLFKRTKLGTLVPFLCRQKRNPKNGGPS
jgi:hypothetical protein